MFCYSCVSSQIAALEAQLKSLEQKQETDISAFLPADQKELSGTAQHQNNANSGYAGNSYCKGDMLKTKKLEQVSKYRNQKHLNQYDQKKPYSKHKR